ncbi:zinc-dependent metalloprotease [Trueperella sp. LYQ141]|uniref:zinc-dependent metalloprotease n=1 Tax=Trueperella sp. LYQ141 TaxID=3391058 RepID=UPI0039836671
MTNTPNDHNDSHDSHSQDPNEIWKNMLREIFGEDSAEIIEQFGGSAFPLPPDFGQMFSPAHLSAFAQQLQRMMNSTEENQIDWAACRNVAHSMLARSGRVDQLDAASAEKAQTALRTASLWLDVSTIFDPPSGTGAAYSRPEMINHSFETIQQLLDPVGRNVGRAFAEMMNKQAEALPEALRNALGNPGSFIAATIFQVLGVQYGESIAELAASSFGSTDTGVPLMSSSDPVLVPANIAEFSENLSVGADEAMLYVAVRECAATRLFAGVPWLRPRILDTIAEIASGFEVNFEAISEHIRDMGEIDMSQPLAMPDFDMSNIFTLELNPDQVDTVERLELLLALVVGWVEEISAQAVAPHLPNAVALREMFSRRYATNNPAKHVWEAQLGIELNPQRLREAATFWQQATREQGAEERDRLWSHPDLLPTANALENPAEFFASDADSSQSDISAELDSFLAQLFAENSEQTNDVPHEPKFGEPHADGDDRDLPPEQS